MKIDFSKAGGFYWFDRVKDDDDDLVYNYVALTPEVD